MTTPLSEYERNICRCVLRNEPNCKQPHQQLMIVGYTPYSKELQTTHHQLMIVRYTPYSKELHTTPPPVNYSALHSI